jgi:hypothetical protein
MAEITREHAGAGSEPPEMSNEAVAESAAWGAASEHENPWYPAAAVVAAYILWKLLPEQFAVGQTSALQWIVPALEISLLAPLIFMRTRDAYRGTTLSRTLSLSLIAVINVINIISLVALIRFLIGRQATDGTLLLGSSADIWLTNVIVFSLWYWELDRGGPYVRRTQHHRQPDFLFPQMVTPFCAPGGWAPDFIDYFYVAFTNATAFSPTDTMPLTKWAKLLMMVQSFTSLVTVALVAARAVNILR